MKKLCVFTLYAEKGASSRYRAYIFQDELKKSFELKWFYFWSNAYATKYMNNKKKYKFHIFVQYLCATIKRVIQMYFIASKSDVVFIQKACVPKMKPTFLKKIKSKGKRIVFDIDDATYLLAGDNTDKIAKLSDVVICGNETLKKHYESLGCNCVLLPTVENTPRYEPFWNDTFESKVIGWIGSAATIHNLELVVNPINELVDRHPEVRFDIICNNDYGYVEKIKNSRLVVWDKEKYVEDLSNFTIGIMPLEDTSFNRGKCGFKLIQYLNMKKPVVGSGVGVNAEIIKGNGLVANEDDEWVAALERLLFDRDKYDFCTNHIETDFFKNYHFSKVASRLVEILDR